MLLLAYLSYMVAEVWMTKSVLTAISYDLFLENIYFIGGFCSSLKLTLDILSWLVVSIFESLKWLNVS